MLNKERSDNQGKGMVLDLVHWFLCVLIYLSKCYYQRKEKKEKTWLEQPRLSSVWHTGLSGGAPDSVRCARPAPVNWPLSGNLQQRTAIIHRTVRWCTGLSGEPTVASATVGRAIRERRVARTNGRQGHRTVRCAPDSVRCAIVPEPQRSTAPYLEGNRAPDNYSDCPVVHRTVRCTTRQKVRLAFQDCLQWLLAALGL